MGIGDTFAAAWNSATSAAKSAASAVADGATWAGGKVVDGAKWAGEKVVDGAKWTGEKVVDGAKWTGEKVVEGAKWTGEKVVEGAQWAGGVAKEGTRRAIRGVTDGIYTGLGEGAQLGTDTGKAVKGVYDKAKDLFTDKPPAQPCINCSGKDKDHDGVLVGYKDGKCVPMTEKGEKVTPQDIQNAKNAGYNPSKNPAFDAERPDEKSRNTSQATKDCCAKCTAGKPPRTIFYVNGINTDRTTHCETLKQIGDMTCATVVGVYNATEGMPKDALQTGQDRALIDAAAGGRKGLAHDGRNPAVDTMSDLIVQETRAGRPPEIMAHSQGGAVTSLALYDANNTLKAGPPGTPGLEGTKVTSFGAAAPSWVQGPEYTHYVHVNDFTPINFGIGDHSSAFESGGGNVVTFSGEPGGPFNTKDPDKHIFAHPTKYHGIDDQLYLKMYDQQNKGGDGTCSCGKR